MEYRGAIFIDRFPNRARRRLFPGQQKKGAHSTPPLRHSRAQMEQDDECAGEYQDYHEHRKRDQLEFVARRLGPLMCKKKRNWTTACASAKVKTRGSKVTRNDGRQRRWKSKNRVHPDGWTLRNGRLRNAKGRKLPSSNSAFARLRPVAVMRPHDKTAGSCDTI